MEKTTSLWATHNTKQYYTEAYYIYNLKSTLKIPLWKEVGLFHLYQYGLINKINTKVIFILGRYIYHRRLWNESSYVGCYIYIYICICIYWNLSFERRYIYVRILVRHRKVIAPRGVLVVDLCYVELFDRLPRVTGPHASNSELISSP